MTSPAGRAPRPRWWGCAPRRALGHSRAARPRPVSAPHRAARCRDRGHDRSNLTLSAETLRVAADAIRLSRRTLAAIKGKLLWAFAHNVAALPLAAAGLLNPMLAGAAMAFSSVFVVSNSLRCADSAPRRPAPGRPADDHPGLAHTGHRTRRRLGHGLGRRHPNAAHGTCDNCHFFAAP